MASGWPYDPGIFKTRSQHNNLNLPFFRLYTLKKNQTWTKPETREYSPSFFRLELSVGLAREPRAQQLLKNEVICCRASFFSWRKSIILSTGAVWTELRALRPFSFLLQGCKSDTEWTLFIMMYHFNKGVPKTRIFLRIRGLPSKIPNKKNMSLKQRIILVRWMTAPPRQRVRKFAVSSEACDMGWGNSQRY